jgi:SAM-dependent methyltransferase
MNSTDRKIHWENIYSQKQSKDLSWYQEVPVTSLNFVKELNLPKTAKIFDNGGGDSHFVDYMFDMGYNDITVLDISETALQKTKERLGKKANKIKWIICDEAKCNPGEQYDLWHDRAAFHFLTDENEIQSYVQTIGKCIKPGGYLVIGTFSEEGPKKCSGIEITQYTEKSMVEKFGKYFKVLKCIKVNHVTPFNTTQNFIFCSFKRTAKPK